MDDRLMTVDEFNRLVRDWAKKVRQAARSTLGSGTHGTGKLAQFLTEYVNEDRRSSIARTIKFHFDRYGVFRAYGAGRGYVCINGQLRRGFRVSSNSAIASVMRDRGYKKSQINQMKMAAKGGEIRRKPLNWLDHHIESMMGDLGEYVQQYYGERALQNFLGKAKNMKIKK